MERWTPWEYFMLIKGAQHKQIDDYEKITKQGMANRFFINGKKPREKKFFDAQKARKNLEKGVYWKDSRQKAGKNTVAKALKALKNWNPEMKGGQTNG